MSHRFPRMVVFKRMDFCYTTGMESNQRNQVKIKTIRLKPTYLLILVLACLIVLAGMIIPQRIRIHQAQEELAKKQEELAQTKYEYEQERRNLDYMRTEEYKIQQGLAKYGWHYKEDTLIEDRDLTEGKK